MKTNQSVAQQSSNALATLPAGAIITSAKGHRNQNGSRMEVSYMVGSSHFQTTVTTGGHRA